MAADSSDECIFCAIARGDAPAERIHEDERTVAFLDISPATEGHALVIPRRHARDLYEVGDDDLAACARTARRIASLARAALGADGVTLMQSNGRAAWQTVFHYHVHVIPRYAGDPLVLPWQPQPGERDAIGAVAARYRDAS